MPSTFAELWSDQWDRKSTTDERTIFLGDPTVPWNPSLLHAGFHCLYQECNFDTHRVINSFVVS